MAESHGGPKGGAHTEADGGHKAPFPPFQKDTFASQLVSLAIVFVVLYVVVSRVALPRVGGVLDARENTINGDLTEAQKLKDESDAALKAYEAELAAARSRAQAIGAETREKLNAASEAERKTFPRQPFSLIFRGPPADVLPEGLHTLEVEGGDSFTIYVMPIHTPARDRQDYQAVFN